MVISMLRFNSPSLSVLCMYPHLEQCASLRIEYVMTMNMCWEEIDGPTISSIFYYIKTMVHVPDELPINMSIDNVSNSENC